MTFQTRKPGDTRPAQDFKHETAWELNIMYWNDPEDQEIALPVSGDATTTYKT